LIRDELILRAKIEAFFGLISHNIRKIGGSDPTPEVEAFFGLISHNIRKIGGSDPTPEVS
jgi:hypothetical protein